ncbi:MAG: hypothetical protein F6J87_27000 [Spirulina sp. SIO3F2]|nr:hypothetical protein [Spirulina sp. SIO3F2]
MKITSEPRAYKLVGSLQLISAIVLLPLSLFLFVQTALSVLLGSGLGESDSARPLLLLLQTQGGMALALLTLFAGAMALYVSWQLMQQRVEKWLKITLILQGTIAIAETLKLSMGIRGNWLSLLTGLFILGYLLKPTLQLGGKALGELVSQGTKRLPQLRGIKRKV